LTRGVRIGEGREAEILEAGPGRVVRLLWSADREPFLAREEAGLRAAAAAGAPVPAVYERVVIDGRPGLVMDRLDGSDLLARVGARPWAVWSSGKLLGRVHSGLNRVVAPADVPDLKDGLAELLERGGERVPRQLAAEAHRALAGLPDGDRLCHGDFHPGNVLLTSAGPCVIDWPGAARGDPAADVCRTILLVELAALPDNAPPTVRRLDRVGRRLLLRSYLRAYGGRPAAAAARWRRALLIARLAEGIDGERELLLAALGADRD
jgi:thiamine kinase